MAPPPHQKPENVLKRANELIGVNQAPAALVLLHEHINSKRSRNVPIAQNTNVATIELVLKKFIQLAVDKVTAAQQKADEVQSTLEATAAGDSNIEDLEASETPESILLATVSGEQSRDRTDRAIVTPWLKFLWEAYRTVLDILRNNARLELLYQSTAMQAFDFCLKYTRKTEFRRLCELLRNHVQTAAKYSSQMHAINLSDPETLQRHLETRFQQLNVAVELELWQEAFRSNIMMANYYEKLTRIFLVGENYLFHAAAWSRYYSLLRQSAVLLATGQGRKADNPPAAENDVQRAASFVLLSALAIPVISTTRSRGAMVDFDEARKNKNSRLTHLLGMSQAPTRAGLFRDALAKSLLKRARPEIRDLYNILEIGADPEMEKYIQPLQQVILTRLFQQLSQVYETVDLAFVENLASFPEPYEVTRATIEKFIMNGNKKGDLSIRMDHATGVLSFDNDVFSSSKAGASAGSAESETGSVQRLQSTPSEIVRSQLTRLAKSLYTTCFYIDPSFSKDRAEARQAALARARAGAEEEQNAILQRKEIIERRKEAASEAQAQKERELAQKKREQEQALQEAEDRRLAAEQKEREERRLKAERDRVRKEELKKQIADLKIGPNALDIDMENLENLDSNELRRMKLAQLEREKNDINEKLRITGKRIDHLERAFRKEEVKKLQDDYDKQIEEDETTYELVKTQTLKDAEEKHKASVELKGRLTRLVPFFNEFRSDLHERRRDEFESRRRDAERELDRQIAARKKEFKERKLREKREREEREREIREAEETAAREREEKQRQDEAKREELARHREQMARQSEEAREKAALQLRREEEASHGAGRRRRGLPRRLLSDLSGPTRSAVHPLLAALLSTSPVLGSGGSVKPPRRSDSRDPAVSAPRLNLAGNSSKPSWRDRQEKDGSGGGARDDSSNRAGRGGARVASGAGAYRMDRTDSGRGANGRNESPAAPPAEQAKPAGGAGRWVPRTREPSGT
ncbi:unnamed protein product [Parascedosporium putredinis]|uniref:Eukaryotic translation initiation factor 3 subunit A n=1 Tax=Parascedosporium putredinis TaxID=1442378 RepID=A0A9P1ME29_9PEZI|nr:unnamed protein product [Parascedosporium putredinis]CAI8000817.1 unnamed protein product [Parascedosporium putredinis]